MNRKIILAAAGLLLGLLVNMPATAAVVSNATFPFSMTVFVPCAASGLGEVVELNGQLHDTFTLTATSKGVFHMDVHDNPQGVSGTGQTTGDLYHAIGMTKFQTISDSPLELVYVDNFHIIGPGTNFDVHDNFHIRVEDGQVTAFHDNFRAQCK